MGQHYAYYTQNVACRLAWTEQITLRCNDLKLQHLKIMRLKEVYKRTLLHFNKYVLNHTTQNILNIEMKRILPKHSESECPQPHEIKHLIIEIKTGLALCVNFIRMFFAGILFEWEGKHHVELTYDPIHFNAITCSESRIFVADSAPGGGVHIHTWRGQQTQSLSHGQLGLHDYDFIWAMNYTNSFGDKLQLAIGDYNSETVHTLHAYNVSDFLAVIALGDNIIIENSISFLNSFICIYLSNYLIRSYHTSKQVAVNCSLF